MHSYTVGEDLQDVKQKVETGINFYKAHTNLTNLNVLIRLYKFVKLLKYQLTSLCILIQLVKIFKM